ncbi:unnamed protein product [Lactuca virosa]|uniref:Uncharacterized protein n=1 Tax=Lactuca virosa TaxID=75947 RepID=A0AAU9MPD8_9ASTR|nr:unnamed protein product [Lactuca virosa]
MNKKWTSPPLPTTIAIVPLPPLLSSSPPPTPPHPHFFNTNLSLNHPPFQIASTLPSFNPFLHLHRLRSPILSSVPVSCVLLFNTKKAVCLRGCGLQF